MDIHVPHHRAREFKHALKKKAISFRVKIINLQHLINGERMRFRSGVPFNAAFHSHSQVNIQKELLHIFIAINFFKFCHRLLKNRQKHIMVCFPCMLKFSWYLSFSCMSKWMKYNGTRLMRTAKGHTKAKSAHIIQCPCYAGSPRKCPGQRLKRTFLRKNNCGNEKKQCADGVSV